MGVKIRIPAFLVVGVMGLATGCSQPASDESGSSATPTSAQQIAAPTAPASEGEISGQISYPSDDLPQDLEICAREVETGYSECNPRGTGDTYAMALPPGRYTVWSQTNDMTGYQAFYTHAVSCGLTVECVDHTPVIVEVRSGVKVPDINPGDWFMEQ